VARSADKRPARAKTVNVSSFTTIRRGRESVAIGHRMDDATYYTRIFLRVLLSRYPHRLSLGALTGVVAHVIVVAVAPLVLEKTSVNLSDINLTEAIFIGIFVFVFPTIFSRYRLDDDIEHKILAIRRIAQEGHFSRAQVRILYLELARQTLHQHTAPPATGVEKETSG
jgi:hypothetical protein